MADIDLEKLETEVDNIETIDESMDDEEKGKQKRQTRQHLKTRRAIEKYLEKKRFRKEIDYLSDDDWDLS